MILTERHRRWPGRRKSGGVNPMLAHEQYDGEVVQAVLRATGWLDRTSATADPHKPCKTAASSGHRDGDVSRTPVCARSMAWRAIQQRERADETDDRDKHSRRPVPPSEAACTDAARARTAIR